MSETEENKYIYPYDGRLTNAYAGVIDIQTKSFSTAPPLEPVGPPPASGRHSKKNGALIGIVLLVALLICFALFGFLYR